VRHVRPSSTSWTVSTIRPTFGVMFLGWYMHVRHVRPSPTILDCPQLSWPTFWGVNSWMVHAPNVRHVPSPTILDCPQLSWPTWCKCVLDGTCTECETCETIPNYPGLFQLSWPTFVNVFLGGTCTECETCETIPNYPGLSSTILAHLWCKCVPWMVHAPNVRHVRPSPTILDCPQLSWPTFGVNVFLGWYMHRM
jgi:hypothetical protein